MYNRNTKTIIPFGCAISIVTQKIKEIFISPKNLFLPIELVEYIFFFLLQYVETDKKQYFMWDGKIEGKKSDWFLIKKYDIKCVEYVDYVKRHRIKNFVRGKLHGEYLQWYNNGQLEKKEFYVHDKQEGEFLYFYKNGKRERVSNFKNGRLHGQTLSWDEDGSLYSMDVYENGKLINSKVVRKEQKICKIIQRIPDEKSYSTSVEKDCVTYKSVSRMLVSRFDINGSLLEYVSDDEDEEFKQLKNI